MASVTSDSDPGSLGLGLVTPSGSPAVGNPTGVSTSPTSQDALMHVLDHVFCLARDSGLRQSLQAAGFTKIHQLIGMSAATMKALSYKAKVAGVVSSIGLLLSEEELLLALQGFARFKANNLGRPLTPADWSSVTEDEFDEYQGNYHQTPVTSHPPMPSSGTSIVPLSANTPSLPLASQSAVAMFRRGIKRDQSLFPVFKDEKDWDDWQRRLRTQATAQGVEDVLDPLFIPMPGSDSALFREQNKYMMAVFTTCVQTDYGKGLIRKYEGTNDAQGLFSELEERAMSSTSAIIIAAELLSYITSATLGRNSWNGTTTSFVLHWEEQVRLHDSYVDRHSRFSPEMKRTLLQNAVNGIPDLRLVKLNADQLLQANGQTVTYDKYRDLLLNACARYDADWHSRG